MFCLSVSVKAAQLISRLGDTQNGDILISTCPALPDLPQISETLDRNVRVMLRENFWNSLKAYFQNGGWLNPSHSANTQGSLDVLHSEKYFREHLGLKDARPSAPALEVQTSFAYFKKTLGVFGLLI